jgi:thiol reductant ABC exporter CydD subunit
MAGIDRRLARSSRAARAHLGAAGVLGVAAAALIVAQAVLLARVIDRVVMHGAAASEVRPTVLALAAVIAGRALVSAGFETSGRLGATRVMSELRARLAHHLLVARPGRRGDERTGELAAAAVGGVDALEAYFAGYLPQLVLATVVPVAVLAWIAPIDLAPAAILAVTVPLLIVFMILIGRAAHGRTRARWQALSLLSAHFLDVVRGLPTLRAHNRDAAQAAALAEVGDRYRRETIGTLRVAFLSALVLELAAMIGTALVAATVGIQLAGGHLTLQAGLTVLLLAPELYAPLRQVGQQYHASADGTAAAERLFAVLDESPAIAAPATPLPPPDPGKEAVRFEQVRFAYPDREADVLVELDLELAAGCMTALVGPSGAGKSTVAALALRLLDPSQGRVTCAGIDLRDVDPDAWRAKVAWVPQRARLFAGSVADNIRLADPGASDERVLDAARDAGALDFISRLPRGLEERIGDGGRRLSAGQAQRIVLARAFLRAAPLLVLDEPTANLDEETAEAIGVAIERLARGRTTLLVVHRAALAARADRIVTLVEGRVAERALPVAA